MGTILVLNKTDCCNFAVWQNMLHWSLAKMRILQSWHHCFGFGTVSLDFNIKPG